MSFFHDFAIASGYPTLAERLQSLNQEIWDLMHKLEPKDEFDGLDVSNLSPPLCTWMKVHKQNPTSMVFVQTGEYYKTYFHDALIVSSTINLPSRVEENVPAITIASTALDRTKELLTAKGFDSVVDESLAVSEVDGLLDEIESLGEAITETIQELKSDLQNILDENEDAIALIKERCEHIQGMDDAQLVEWYQYEFDRIPTDLDGLRVEWQAFVQLNEYWHGDLEACWNKFVVTSQATQWNDKDSENDEDF